MIMGLVLVVLANVAGAQDGDTGPGGEVGTTAVTNVWTGNGTNNGVCSTFQSDTDLNPGPGQQAWLFILNQVDPNTGWSLSATFNPGGTVAGTIIKTENSNIHFEVLSSDNAVLTAAVATNADDEATSGNLVVSHCEHGAAVTTSSTPPARIKPTPATSSGTLVPLPVRGRPCVAAAAAAVGPGVVTSAAVELVVVAFVTDVGDTSVVVVVGDDVDVLVLVLVGADVLVLVEVELVDVELVELVEVELVEVELVDVELVELVELLVVTAAPCSQ